MPTDERSTDGRLADEPLTDASLTDKRVLITGGSGSVGNVLVRRVLAGELGQPREVVVFSRDENKHYEMRRAFAQSARESEDVAYRSLDRLRFRVGDVADYAAVCAALRDAQVVLHAAAMKQVPACEYAPFEAAKTNILGAQNIVRAIRDQGYPVETVVGISTDKACKPVNVMGMTKAVQERLFVQANLDCPHTRFVIARYGNVLASRGSVVPLFLDQIRRGGPITLTTPEMTRFWMSLDEATDAIFCALRYANRGEILVPRVRSARVADIAAALLGARQLPIEFVGSRPGEKTHEVLISEEEAPRATHRRNFLVIQPALPQLQRALGDAPFLGLEFGSAAEPLPAAQVREFLERRGVLVDGVPAGAAQSR